MVPIDVTDPNAPAACWEGGQIEIGTTTKQGEGEIGFERGLDGYDYPSHLYRYFPVLMRSARVFSFSLGFSPIFSHFKSALDWKGL